MRKVTITVTLMLLIASFSFMAVADDPTAPNPPGTFHLKQDFEPPAALGSGSDGMTGYGTGDHQGACSIIADAAPFTGEAQSLHFTKTGTTGYMALMVNGTSMPDSVGCVVESVFRVNSNITLVGAPTVLKAYMMSANFWVTPSTTPGMCRLKSWQGGERDYGDIALDQWHSIQGIRVVDPASGTITVDYYIDEEYWRSSNEGVWDGEYNNRFDIGYRHNQDVGSIDWDHLWIYTIEDLSIGEGYVISLESESGGVYKVLWSEDLVSSVWPEASDFIIANGDITPWEDKGKNPGRLHPSDTSVSQRFYKLIEREDVYYQPGHPIVIAGRGGERQTPENTLAGIIPSMQLGFGIEVDVSTTQDGELVLMHDVTIGRTTDGPNVATSSVSLAQLKQYDAGSWFEERFEGTRVPTFEEVVIAIDQYRISPAVPTVLWIDIKDVSSAGEQEIVSLVSQYGLLDEAFVYTQSTAMSQRYKNINSNFRIGKKVQSSSELNAAIADSLVDVVIAADFTPTATEISNIKNAGKQALWNGGGQELWRRDPDKWNLLRDRGIDGIMTSFPLDAAANWH